MTEHRYRAPSHIPVPRTETGAVCPFCGSSKYCRTGCPDCGVILPSQRSFKAVPAYRKRRAYNPQTCGIDAVPTDDPADELEEYSAELAELLGDQEHEDATEEGDNLLPDQQELDDLPPWS